MNAAARNSAGGESALREKLCRFGASLFARGLTHGSTGNLSARLEDGRLLVTPTGSSLGFLDPAELALVSAQGVHLSGRAPTKEIPLHAAFYARRDAPGAVAHLHSHHAVALSLLEGLDPHDALPKLTPYASMLLGQVRLLPYMRPGDPALGAAVAALRGEVSAVILSNHGPVVSGADVDRAVFAIEELEATARLALEVRDRPHSGLTDQQIDELLRAFAGVP